MDEQLKWEYTSLIHLLGIGSFSYFKIILKTWNTIDLDNQK